MVKQFQTKQGWGLLLLLLLPLLTSAQDLPFTKEYYIGAKGGLVFSRVKFKPYVDMNLSQGNAGGLILRMISEPHVGIQMEFNYLQKGWEEKPLPGATHNYYHKLTYLDIPIMTHANLGNNKYRFTLNIGPSVAFLLSDAQGMNPSDLEIPSSPPVAYWGQPIDRSVDFLFVGGIGSEYHFNRHAALALDIRLFYSLTNLYDSKKYGYDPSQTNGIQATLAYLFRLGKEKK